MEVQSDSSNNSTRRKEPGTPAALLINGREFQCRLLTIEGGYHDIYEIVDEQPVYKNVNNSDLLVRVPIDQWSNPVGKGMLVYNELKGKVNLPTIYNDPMQDGFYVVEKIVHQCDPREWENELPLQQLEDGAISMRQLTPIQITQYKRLKQIEQILYGIANEIWHNGGKEPVPDFRPANIRFRVDDTLVLIDFSEESEFHDRNNMQEFAAKLKENVDQFSGLIRERDSKVKPEIYRFLTRRFPRDLLDLMNTYTGYII